jgi:cyclic pyranopterin phosphate synthase
LFAPVGYPLAPLLQQGDALRAAVARLWHARADRYSELRATTEHPLQREEMYALGG